MKRIYSIFFISLLFVTANAQRKLTDKEFDGLKGKVKSVASSNAEFENKDGKSVEKRSAVKYEEFYDENGNTSQTISYIIGDKNIYSVLDGDRVYKNEIIKGIGGGGISSASIAE